MDRPTKLRLAVIALCVLGSMLGCATARPVVTVEAPRELAPSETHVYQQAVHAPTDLSPAGFVAADSDITDGAAPSVADGSAVEAPIVQEKNAHGF